MAEYIEREALMVALCKEIVGDGDYYNGKDDMQDEIRDMVSRFPAADVAPVRHGRWEEADWVESDCHSFGTIRTPKAAIRCSNCKNCFKKELLWKDNYCPNCGTDMRGRNDE